MGGRDPSTESAADMPGRKAGLGLGLDAGLGVPYEVVAVGASAGGLYALGLLLEGLPPDFPVPIVIVQHLDPEHTSLMAPILARRTRLKVKEAEAGDSLRAGWVYIAPPGQHLLVGADATLVLSRSPRVHYARPSVDVLFGSLAEHYGRRAIAVVLTGAGYDGGTGMKAVKDAGGTTIVQDPGTAEYASMPGTATDTGAVDYSVPLEELPALLISLTMEGKSP